MLGDLGKLIVAKGFKKLSKVQKIAQSGHTDPQPLFHFWATLIDIWRLFSGHTD